MKEGPLPNRILREGIIDSERVNALSPEAELFYRRLMSKVDDFGRFHGHPQLILAACYPLQLDRITAADVSAWLAECSRDARTMTAECSQDADIAPLITVYEVGNKKFLQINNFGQRTRTESKFPAFGAHDARTMSAESEQPAARARTPSTTHTTPPPTVLVIGGKSPEKGGPAPEMSTRFEEFWARWPRQTAKDSAAHAWAAYVTVENETRVFACLERFLQSADVANGAVPYAGPTPSKPGWLADCARQDFVCNWPPRTGPTAERKLSPTEKAKITWEERRGQRN